MSCIPAIDLACGNQLGRISGNFPGRALAPSDEQFGGNGMPVEGQASVKGFGVRDGEGQPNDAPAIRQGTFAADFHGEL